MPKNPVCTACTSIFKGEMDMIVVHMLHLLRLDNLDVPVALWSFYHPVQGDIDMLRMVVLDSEIPHALHPSPVVDDTFKGLNFYWTA